jgi:hypothetical protein
MQKCMTLAGQAVTSSGGPLGVYEQATLYMEKGRARRSALFRKTMSDMTDQAL